MESRHEAKYFSVLYTGTIIENAGEDAIPVNKCETNTLDMLYSIVANLGDIMICLLNQQNL